MQFARAAAFAFSSTALLGHNNYVGAQCNNRLTDEVRFHQDWITRSESCSWVARNQNVCNKMDLNKDVLVAQVCPGQCQISGCAFIPPPVPTKAPTGAPSDFPSDVPSDLPSTMPSELPTGFPTKALSSTPSAYPTPTPTRSPTVSPTTGPSGSPSYNPTTVPTLNPTKGPTGEPMQDPGSSYEINLTPIPTYSKYFSASEADQDSGRSSGQQTSTLISFISASMLGLVVLLF